MGATEGKSVRNTHTQKRYTPDPKNGLESKETKRDRLNPLKPLYIIFPIVWCIRVLQ